MVNIVSLSFLLQLNSQACLVISGDKKLENTFRNITIIRYQLFRNISVCCTAVLVYWCSTGVLLYWCTGVLVYWCTGEGNHCFSHVLMSY